MTMHDPNKVLMGTTTSSVKEVANYPGSVAAGIAVREKSDGSLSTAKVDGSLRGVSLGKDLSNANRTAVCVSGLGVPMQLKSGFNPTVGAVVEIDDATGLATGDGTKTAVNAVYASGRVGGNGVDAGVAEDGTAVGVALIDFPGGL